MENIEFINNSDDYIIDSIFSISLKSEYINLSKKKIKKYIEDEYNKVVIIKNDKSIFGFLIYFLLPPEIDIIFIAVYPYNNGYGNKLLSYLFNEAKNNNVNSIKLDLHEKNIIAKNFYIKNGFKEISIRNKYYNNQFDAIIMEKQIDKISGIS